MAEEVFFLYPENPLALEQRKNDPRHRFFKRYGDAVPAKDWNHPGTKQGVYMIGPDAEYLDGGHGISGNAAVVKERLQKALERWEALRAEKGYANLEVPRVAETRPPEVIGKNLVFRVFLRDLPRGETDDSGRRFRPSDIGRGWMSFVDWAWNLNWIAFADPKAFLPGSTKEEEPLDPAVLARLCRTVLVDNVRGQTPHWRAEDLKEARLGMRRLADEDGDWVIEYRGAARMESATQSYAPRLYGRGRWDPRDGRFRSLEIVAIGDRSGKGVFNQRSRDLGPAPMGIALVLSP
ncbi:MAG: hypothetical protein H6807_04965 [Planctomycetes bacterium]|nr:hypothetical protein [Planctomycetota bacterium]